MKKTMQPENKNMSDLEYLAVLGLEQVQDADADVEELRQAMRKSVPASGGGFYFLYISLITGMFVGVSVFFNFYNAPRFLKIPAHPEAHSQPEHTEAELQVYLDTVNVSEDRFVKNAVRPTTARIKLAAPLVNKDTIEETAEVMNKINNDSILEVTITQTENLKYAPNSPIVYIHDYKISDYKQLYFRKNYGISLRENSGVPVLYASVEDMKKSFNLLDVSPAYYLHEALGDAMLAFKKRNYGRCLWLLNQIAGITDNDVNCRFYSGMCYYYRKNYSEAIKQFDACISNANNSFLQEAEFYKAMSLRESGDREAANLLFRKINDENGFYTVKAMEMLGD